MKFKDAGSGGPSGERRPPPRGMGGLRGDLRMEWMDPMSWRLPSGKALAEFALQAGFLAPLMLVGPRFKKPKRSGGLGTAGAAEKQFREAPGPSGSFRETGFRETGAGIRETK